MIPHPRVARIVTGLVLAAAGCLAPLMPRASAQQTPPVARVYGTITINGQNAPANAVVAAFSGSTSCGTAADTGLYGVLHPNQYHVDIDSSQPACSTPGATLTFKVNGVTANETVQVPAVPGGSIQLNLTVTGSAAGSATATYSPGWNLVGGPAGTTFSQAANPLYTFQTGNTAYQSIPNTSPINAGLGYWAYFTATTTVNLSGTATLPFTVTAPAGQYIMVGNPTTQSVTVTGGDVIYTFNTASNSYSNAATSATLAPGQGAWVFSANGGAIAMK